MSLSERFNWASTFLVEKITGCDSRVFITKRFDAQEVPTLDAIDDWRRRHGFVCTTECSGVDVIDHAATAAEIREALRYALDGIDSTGKQTKLGLRYVGLVGRQAVGYAVAGLLEGVALGASPVGTGLVTAGAGAGLMGTQVVFFIRELEKWAQYHEEQVATQCNESPDALTE